MFVVVIFHSFTCLENLCGICGGKKCESNTRKKRTRTHLHSLTTNWRVTYPINNYMYPLQANTLEQGMNPTIFLKAMSK